MQDQNDETSQPTSAKPTYKGKKPINPIAPTGEEISHSTNIKFEVPNAEKKLVQTKPIHQESNQIVDSVKVDRNHFGFILQKELAKVKIFIPLTELLKQPNYKKQVSYFMDVSLIDSSYDNLNL